MRKDECMQEYKEARSARVSASRVAKVEERMRSNGGEITKGVLQGDGSLDASQEPRFVITEDCGAGR